MCSTPQKHPAATVALAAPSGVVIVLAPSGFNPSLVEVEKGRNRREMNVGIAEAMRSIKIPRSKVRGRRKAD
jgi:hypothetical protein